MLAAATGLLLAALAASGAPAKGYYSLADKVDDATFICIGRVTAVVDVSTSELAPSERWGRMEALPLARVEVERVLEGDPSTSVVFHEAWGTWMCDTTSAEVGERALFLFGPGVIALEAEPARERVRAAVGGAVVLRNVGSGDGIVRISELGLVSCPDAPSALGGGLLELSTVLAYVDEVLRFAPDALAVRARAGTSSTHAYRRGKGGGAPFDLRILPDGSARLARDLGPRERRSTFTFDEREWSALLRELQALTRDERREVGEPKSHDWIQSRVLRLRFGEASLAFLETNPQSIPPRDSAERAPFEDALRAWDLLRAAIDCLECVDHAERDRAALEGR